MAYHKWDAEYWEEQAKNLLKRNQDLQCRIVELQSELRKAEEKNKVLDLAKRPILFLQEGSVKNLPESLRFLYTVIEYRHGYNKPEMVMAHNPF